jgi:uncharacterized protein
MPAMWPLMIVFTLLFLCFAVLASHVHLATRVVLRRRSPDADDPPGRYGLACEDVAFETADGLTLRGWFIPANGVSAVGSVTSRRTVIFAHGQAGSMDRDTGQAPFLHEAGFDVLMFDFRGHGRSAGEYVTMGYIERLDLRAAIDYLERRGVDRVGVLGWSMGGAAALAAAAEDRRIAAVVSDSGYASFRRVLAGGWVGHGVPLLVARPLAWLMWREASRRLGVDLAACEPRRVVGPDFRCPLLLIQGDSDPYVPLGDVEALAAASGGPVELWRVPGGSHRDARDHCPEEYHRRVTEFFVRWLT